MKRIFVVDDDAGVRDLFYAFLRKNGYDVCVMNEGGMILDELSGSQPPDMVITDNDQCYGDEGIRLSARIKDKNPNFPVILMSGGSEPESHRADRFIKKPPNWALLLKTIAELLGEASPEGAS